MKKIGKLLILPLLVAAFMAGSAETVENEATAITQAIPGGNTIGLKLYLDGLLVVGLSDITSAGEAYSPGKQGGVLKGDRITHCNGERIENVRQYSNIIQECGSGNVILTIVRNDDVIQKTVTPVFYDDAGEYKTGIWVRDSAAGIGTVTFMLSDGSFAALGHGISDVDTEQIIAISKSQVTGSSITSVIKGSSGAPGELRGIFDDSSKGEVYLNAQNGIYGHLSKNSLSAQPMNIAKEAEVYEGQACILSNIDGNDIEEFQIEIQRVMRYHNSDGKCMIIKVTDESLLARTGGIVQGMSGSPIIQDGKIVGAVTHVFLNDPTKGYGIFAERMLVALEKTARQ